MNTIVRMIFGSHLYGTDTPTSDKDYKWKRILNI
jgi:predicted nucleotidyltransferase